MISAPAAKAFCEPVSTMQPMALFFSNASSALFDLADELAVERVQRLRRFRVMTPTAPLFSTRMVSNAAM